MRHVCFDFIGVNQRTGKKERKKLYFAYNAIGCKCIRQVENKDVKMYKSERKEDRGKCYIESDTDRWEISPVLHKHLMSKLDEIKRYERKKRRRDPFYCIRTDWE